MIQFSAIQPEIKAVIFELDNVLIPEKDYDLQVYYLFANFLEYLETFPPAQDVVAFMSKRYEIHGKENMFEEVVKTFGIAAKYQENLNLLFKNAKLPLKLLLYKEALELLQELIVNRKQIFILTKGDPEQQLNKLKQAEWNGLEKYLKVYFREELGDTCFDFIKEENNLESTALLFVGNGLEDKELANKNNISYWSLNS
jgi:FMN phosphatase YigB (HAD superfamily)